MDINTAPTKPTLYYDGGCPVCSREIAMYKGQPGADNVCWVDITRVEAEQLGPELDREAAMSRLHLRTADGRLVSGAEAFTTLWKALPRWAWLGRIMGSRPLLPLLDIAYRMFLRLRIVWRRT